MRHIDDLNTWTLEEPLKDDKPLPFFMTFRSKTNKYGGLEKHDVRCAIRGDIILPGLLDLDETRTASHMPSQERRRMLLAAASAEGYVVEP